MIARKLAIYLGGVEAVANKLTAPKWGVRIRSTSIPKGMPLPYVRLTEIDGRPAYHLGGELPELPVRVQVDVWAESEDEADAIAELIRLAPLSGYRGTWRDKGGDNPTAVKAVTIENEGLTFEDPKDGSDDTRFRNTRDYQITYERQVN